MQDDRAPLSADNTSTPPHGGRRVVVVPAARVLKRPISRACRPRGKFRRTTAQRKVLHQAVQAMMQLQCDLPVDQAVNGEAAWRVDCPLPAYRVILVSCANRKIQNHENKFPFCVCPRNGGVDASGPNEPAPWSKETQWQRGPKATNHGVESAWEAPAQMPTFFARLRTPNAKSMGYYAVTPGGWGRRLANGADAMLIKARFRGRTSSAAGDGGVRFRRAQASLTAIISLRRGSA
jgi:hypothetical protein